MLEAQSMADRIAHGLPAAGEAAEQVAAAAAQARVLVEAVLARARLVAARATVWAEARLPVRWAARLVAARQLPIRLAERLRSASDTELGACAALAALLACWAC